MQLLVLLLAIGVNSLGSYTDLEDRVIFLTTCTGCGNGVNGSPSTKVNGAATWDHIAQVLNHFYGKGYAIESHVASHGVQDIVLLKQPVPPSYNALDTTVRQPPDLSQ